VRIYRNEGAGALWRGLPPTLLMAVPQTVIYFTAYDQLKARLGTENPYYAPLIAGPVARTFAVSIISPIEMVRTKIQAESVTPAARDYWRLVTNAVKTDGVLSLWRGLGATLLRDVPFSAFYWLGYERLQPRFAQRFAAGAPANAPPQEAGDATLLAASFAAGAASGTVAAAVTLPFDVVKTRQQTFLGETMIGVRTRCGGPIAVMRDIVRTQGAQGLFVGLTPRIAKVAPACAIMISSYEAGKAFFARQHHAAALDLINGVQ
jgi:solute carrier family 25 protein 39/40